MAGRLQAPCRESRPNQTEMMLPRTARQTQPDPLLGTPAQKPQAHPPSQQEWMSPKPLRPLLPACLLMVSAHSCPPPLGRSPNAHLSPGVSAETGGFSGLGWAAGSSERDLARMAHTGALSLLLLPHGAGPRLLLPPSSYPECGADMRCCLVTLCFPARSSCWPAGCAMCPCLGL